MNKESFGTKEKTLTEKIGRGIGIIFVLCLGVSASAVVVALAVKLIIKLYT
jgi:tetrahydromethanopterin S-methyltransferase subunit G